MPDLSYQSADFQDCFIGGAREQIELLKNESCCPRMVELWLDLYAPDIIKTKKATFERRPESPDSDFDVDEDEEFGVTGEFLSTNQNRFYF